MWLPTASQLMPLLIASQPLQLPTATLTCPTLDLFAPAGIVDMLPDLVSTLLASLLTGPPPPPHPNTQCERPIFNVSDTPATTGMLDIRHWSQFLDLYPNQAFAAQLHGALQHGVKLGYSGLLCNAPRLEVANLPMDSNDVDHLHREIQAHLQEGHLCQVNNPSSIGLVCSPVGVVPKPHSDKRRTIYHLSHLCKPGSGEHLMETVASFTQPLEHMIGHTCSFFDPHKQR